VTRYGAEDCIIHASNALHHIGLISDCFQMSTCLVCPREEEAVKRGYIENGYRLCDGFVAVKGHSDCSSMCRHRTAFYCSEKSAKSSLVMVSITTCH